MIWIGSPQKAHGKEAVAVPGGENDLLVPVKRVHGKARHEAAHETVDTGSSKFNIMVSPTGLIISVSQHIKE